MPTPQNIVPTLQIMHGPMAGRLYQLDRDVTIIGRNPDCDVVLQPKSVSRKHAAIVRKGVGFELKDMGSTRGTLVNGQKLARAGPAQGRRHAPDRRGAAHLQQARRRDPGGGRRAVDGLRGDRRPEPERSPFPAGQARGQVSRAAADRPGAGRDAGLERGTGPDLQFAVRDLPEGRAGLRLAQRRRPATPSCPRSSGRGPDRPASSRSARRS